MGGSKRNADDISCLEIQSGKKHDAVESRVSLKWNTLLGSYVRNGKNILFQKTTLFVFYLFKNLFFIYLKMVNIFEYSKALTIKCKKMFGGQKSWMFGVNITEAQGHINMKNTKNLRI